MPTDTPRLRRPDVRAALVGVAEKVAQTLPQKAPEKTQLSRLVTVAGQASCGAEIANYLRYQAARGQWPLKETDAAIDAFEKTLREQSLEAADEVEAWRLFAGYLSRARQYLVAKEGSR